MDNNKDTVPNISGVPEQIQQNIKADLDKRTEVVKQPLNRLGVGISVSNNEDLYSLGFSDIHLKDLLIELVRHLLINDMVVVYGGDLRKEGFTEIFSDLAFQYRRINDGRDHYFKNFFAYPIYCQLSKQHELAFKGSKTVIRKVPPPVELKIDSNVYLPPTTIEDKLVWALSLSEMRNVMITETAARVLVGGKAGNYLGKIPGVIEEAQITLSQDKPLYLVGALGGGAKQVINALLGKGMDYATHPFHASESYRTFKTAYNKLNGVEEIDSNKTATFFANYGLNKLSRINGLSEQENLRLFETQHLSEILYYIFKGLTACLPR